MILPQAPTDADRLRHATAGFDSADGGAASKRADGLQKSAAASRRCVRGRSKPLPYGADGQLDPALPYGADGQLDPGASCKQFLTFPGQHSIINGYISFHESKPLPAVFCGKK